MEKFSDQKRDQGPIMSESILKLSILSGGAAAGVVKGLQQLFESSSSCRVEATFSAVGAMREELLSGKPCDLIILTKAMIDSLIASGHVVKGSNRSLGIVRTGVAIKSGHKPPEIITRDNLFDTLQSAQGIYFPDPDKATAGIHVFSVLKQLGLDKEKSSALRIYPNGAIAMAEMAKCQEDNLIGSTQVTEINITPGVKLIGMLPKEFELATDYCLGICTNAKEPELAKIFADMLTSPDAANLRKTIGFEVA